MARATGNWPTVPVRQPISVHRLLTDRNRFQARRTAHAEAVAASIERAGWRPDKAGVIHVWPDRFRAGKNGVRFWVIDGHSRLEGHHRLLFLPDADPRRNPPRSVECMVHWELDEAGAIALSKELNASSAAFTPTEMARIVREADDALQETEPDLGPNHRFERLCERFAGKLPQELSRDLPLAWLPAETARLTDEGQFPISAARALGRFIRDTGIEPARADELALRFMRQGMPVGEFIQFLTEHSVEVERVAQSDLFGTLIVAQFDASRRARVAERSAAKELELIRHRRIAFADLEGTDAAPTDAQRAVLAREREREKELVRSLDELRARLRRAVQFGAQIAAPRASEVEKK